MHKLEYATPEPRWRRRRKELFRLFVDSLDQGLLLPALVLIMVATAILLLLGRTLDLQ